MQLSGRTILLTGAAGGIGSAIARDLAAIGCSLVLVDVDVAGLERLGGEIGDSALAVAADVTDLGQLEAAVKAGEDRFGVAVSVAIANAAMDAIAPVGEIEPAEFDRVVAVNLLGTFRTVRASLPGVRAHEGHALFVNSMGSIMAPPYQAAYAASKAGITALADSLRIELRDSGATIGQMYFGAIDTEHFRTGMAHPLMQRANRRIPKSFMKAAPVADAAVAVRKAIEKRARTAVFPKSNRLMVAAPQLMRPMIERRIST